MFVKGILLRSNKFWLKAYSLLDWGYWGFVVNELQRKWLSLGSILTKSYTCADAFLLRAAKLYRENKNELSFAIGFAGITSICHIKLQNTSNII